METTELLYPYSWIIPNVQGTKKIDLPTKKRKAWLLFTKIKGRGFKIILLGKKTQQNGISILTKSLK